MLAIWSLIPIPFLNPAWTSGSCFMYCWSLIQAPSHVHLFATPWTWYSPWNSPGQNNGVGSLSLLQWIFLTQQWNWGLLHCRWVFYQLSCLVWGILSITLLVREVNIIKRWFQHSLALPFFGIGMKTDLFQPCGHRWVFQTCWHFECST